MEIFNVNHQLSAYLPIIFFIFGAFLGSFFNVIIHRIPNGKSIIHPASSCPHCHQPIKPYDNIPILSYLILRGKCRHCDAKISWRYPFVELLSGFLFVWCYYYVGLNLQLIPAIMLISMMLVITFIDIDKLIIPDKITFPGMLLGLSFSFLPGGLSIGESVIGLVVGGVILYLIALFGSMAFKKDAMGGGDIKLAAVIGAFLGWQGVLITLILSSLVGSLIGIFIIALSSNDNQQKSHTIPYGPFLALGSIIALFFGNDLIRWYADYLRGF
ncbi:MAG: prepilin peptidase [candidate division Zixibacteria bacterium]|nr:prepilin peptidase [candidate division Zixibacteria bacterium]